MGSLNSDGTRISQSRNGQEYTVSADRVESETNLDQTPEAASDELGTNAYLTTSQYSTVAICEAAGYSLHNTFSLPGDISVLETNLQSEINRRLLWSFQQMMIL